MLYHLFEKDNSPRDEKNNIGTWDTYDSFVVRAKSETEARKLASEVGGDLWNDPAYTGCVKLVPEGDSDIIVGSFNAG